jgi:hypothetical protein
MLRGRPAPAPTPPSGSGTARAKLDLRLRPNSIFCSCLANYSELLSIRSDQKIGFRSGPASGELRPKIVVVRLKDLRAARAGRMCLFRQLERRPHWPSWGKVGFGRSTCGTCTTCTGLSRGSLASASTSHRARRLPDPRRLPRRGAPRDRRGGADAADRARHSISVFSLLRPGRRARIERCRRAGRDRPEDERGGPKLVSFIGKSSASMPGCRRFACIDSTITADRGGGGGGGARPPPGTQRHPPGTSSDVDAFSLKGLGVDAERGAPLAPRSSSLPWRRGTRGRKSASRHRRPVLLWEVTNRCSTFWSPPISSSQVGTRLLRFGPPGSPRLRLGSAYSIARLS